MGGSMISINNDEELRVALSGLSDEKRFILRKFLTILKNKEFIAKKWRNES